MNTVLDFRRSNVAGVVSRKVYIFGSWRPRSAKPRQHCGNINADYYCLFFTPLAAHVEPDVPRASERCKYFIFALLAPWNNPAKCAVGGLHACALENLKIVLSRPSDIPAE